MQSISWVKKKSFPLQNKNPRGSTRVEDEGLSN